MPRQPNEVIPALDLDDLRASVAGARIGIIHYGEHVTLDDGYRPARMGQLAEWLTSAGAIVRRFVPTYSDIAGFQRSESWTGTVTREGIIHMVKTRSFESSRSPARFRFLREFAQGAAAAVAETGPYDLLIIGFPPPGVASAIRSQSEKVPILADIRDLWPDALFGDPHKYVAAAAQVAGQGLAKELKRVDGVVAMSNTMLERAPQSKRLQAIPHSISESLREVPIAIEDDSPMQAVFVGLLTDFFDMESLISGWARFVSQRTGTDEPVLRIFGSGNTEEQVREWARPYPSIRCEGWVASSEIPRLVAEADIGVVPPRAGLGTTLSNKVLEYLGTGVYILNSLEPESAEVLEVQGLGARVASTPAGWAHGFADFERDLKHHRADRHQRQQVALAAYGREGIEPRWLSEIVKLISQPS